MIWSPATRTSSKFTRPSASSSDAGHYHAPVDAGRRHAAVPLEEPEVRHPDQIIAAVHPPLPTPQPDIDGGPAIVLYEVRIIAARIFSMARAPAPQRRRPTGADPQSVASLRFRTGDAGNPGRGLRGGHSDSEPRCRWHSAAGCSRAVADGHRQEPHLPDRRVHTLSLAPGSGQGRCHTPRVLIIAPHSPSSSRSGRCASPGEAILASGFWPSTGASTTTAARSAPRAVTCWSARGTHRLPEAAHLVADPCRGARHRRGGPHVRHGLHRRPALHPAAAAQAGAAAIVPVFGHPLLPGAGADLGGHEQPDPDHDHAQAEDRGEGRARAVPRRPGREVRPAARPPQARGRRRIPHRLLQHTGGGSTSRGPPHTEGWQARARSPATSIRRSGSRS